MNNKLLIEYLNEHLNRVNEVSEDPASVEKLILPSFDTPYTSLAKQLA